MTESDSGGSPSAIFRAMVDLPEPVPPAIPMKRGVWVASGMVGLDDSMDSTAHQEIADDSHALRTDRRDEIVEDAVGDVLVESALVAIAPEVELEALQLDAGVLGRIADLDRREVG